MQKVLGIFCLIFGLAMQPASAEDTVVNESAEEVEGVDELVEYGNTLVSKPKIIELLPQEDDLYDGAELKPLSGKLSDAEKNQENAGSIEDTPNPNMPELLCSNGKLQAEIRKFIDEYIGKQTKQTVPARRRQVLLTKNMHAFEEVKEADLKKDFEASAAIMYLKINENREIYRICSSRGNNYKDFDNINVIIYPFLNYYKVVVANLISVPEKMDEATFIFNW